MPSGKPVLKPAAKKDRLEEERELLRRLLEQEGLGSPAEQAGSEQGPASPEAAGAASSFYPLSSQQEQLWFLDQFQPASDFYNVPLVLRLKGELNASRLEQSLQEVVRRHEILRTCFVLDENGDPKQSVLQKTSGIGLPLTDLRDLSSSEREERAKKIVAEQGKTIFDLSHAPLFRGALLRMDEKEYVFALTMHHILCDEWSLGVFMEELTELYEAYEKGEESPLPQLGMQYGEYARDQWEGLRAGKFRQQMEYWKTELAGMPQALELQTDYTRQVHQSFRGGIQHQALESELLDGLNALARSEGASMFMTLLAVFQVLLMRYTGQEDFGIGTSIANRGRSSTQRLIGFFLNTLVMRARLRGEPSFRQVQQQVRTAALNAYEHQDLPFQRVVEELAPGRDVSRNPLVQVMFTVRKPAKSKAGRFDVGEFEAGIETSKFDLTLIVEESDEPKIAFNYSTELFESETIVRMLGHYHRLLQAVVRSQEVRVWDLPLLTDAEMAQLIQWNRTDRQYEREKSAAELFEQCAAKMPNAVAVEYQGRELTYGELNRKSNRLAHRLRELGVHSEQRVAIYLERGLEMVVGLLSVLKAQGAYVPMDPQYPQEHLWYMLRDSAPRVLLTQAHLREALGTIDGHVAVVDLGGALGDSEWLQRLPETNPESVRLDPQADPLAYLIYTSGSTGMPKGVMVSHRNLVSSTTARRLVYGDLGRFLLLSSISFDSSVAGIFGSLLHGGTLIIASSDVVRDPWLLHQEVQSRGVETLLCVPSLWKHFLEYPASREQKKQLRRVIVAGEVCPPDLVAKSAQLEPQVKLFNEYGPTEGTVWASVHRCIPTPGSRSVPIGRPIANTHIYILDARGKRVPVGVVGELYLGGAGVARGYWARPTLTAERFLPNPFADERSMRMYRTGDLARWLPDGTIEFIGRNDAQVKIRGYRVELGEIERVLREHPDVQDVVVLPQHTLDLAQLHSIPAYLHLRIIAPNELDGPIRQPAGQVSRPVHSHRALIRKWIGKKALRCESRPGPIATSHTRTSEIQLSNDSNWNSLTARIQDVDMRVRNRPTNRHRPTTRSRNAAVHARPYGAFGWPVFVEQLNLRLQLSRFCNQVRGTDLTSDDHAAKLLLLLPASGILQKVLPQRRYAQQGLYSTALHFLVEQPRIANHIAGSDDERASMKKASEDAGDGAIKRDGGQQEKAAQITVDESPGGG